MIYLDSRHNWAQSKGYFGRPSGLTDGENLINVLHNKGYFVKLQGVLALINVSSARFKFSISGRGGF